MKYIVILGDGMADTPYEGLGFKTPLDLAYKPNIDGLAKVSICGMCKTVPDGIKPGSDVANLSVLGYSPLKYYSGRSPLEALSIGVDMAVDDLAVRCNLVTLSDEENYADKSMLDYSAGEISSMEAAELISAVQSALGNDVFAFYSGVSYRHCLIRHHGVCGTDYTPPHDISGKVIGEYLPKGLYGDEMLSLMIASYEVLKEHPINLKRIAEGKNPANSIWLWGEGSKPSLPNFEGLRGLRGAMISAVDLLKGIAIASGMDVIEVEGATGTVKTNFVGKAQACVDAIRNGYDYVYLHMEAPDECGHQGDSEGKVKSIELIDEQVVGYILSELKDVDLRILICPDHPTPLETKTHSSEPIPFVIYDSTCIKEGTFAYTENECRNTGLVLNSGDDLVKMFLNKDEDDDMKEELNDFYNADENVDTADGVNDVSDLDSDSPEETMAFVGDSDSVEENAEFADDVAEDSVDSDYDNEVTDSDASADDEQVAMQGEESAQDESEQTTDDEAMPAQGGNMVIVSGDGEQSAEQEDSKGDAKGKKNKKNGKNEMSPKKKKVMTILISVAVLAVLITIAVLTPILVVNAPKVFINKAEDFSKPIKDKKEIIVLKKDITVEGDLTIGLNVDFNKKQLTVNGTLTLENPKNGAMILGTKSGKEFAGGGQIIANEVVVKNATDVNMLANVEAKKFKVDHVANMVVNGSLGVREAFDIESSNVVLNETDLGCDKINGANSAITLNKPAKIDINLVNSKLRANSDIGNVVLDKNSELRLYGTSYNDFDSKELGTITGGKLVFVDTTGNAGWIVGASKVWIDRYSQIKRHNCLDVSFIDILETPQFIMLTRDGANVHIELSSVDILAKYVVVTIDNGEVEKVFDIVKDNIGADENRYVFNLETALNKVGNHEIKVVLRSNDKEQEFIKDSDPYFTKHTHYITLDRVGDPKVEGNVLSFKSVDFAESYDVLFDGILINIKNEVKAGEIITYDLSKDENFIPLLAEPGNHSIIIVSKSSVEGINPSEKAYAKFPPITGNLKTPELKFSIDENNNDNVVLNWKNIENAIGYKLELIADGNNVVETIEVGNGTINYVFTKEQLANIKNIKVTAIGDKYYNNASAEIPVEL